MRLTKAFAPLVLFGSIVLIGSAGVYAAENSETFKINAVKLAAAPVIDGDLSDEVWDSCVTSGSKVVIDYNAGGGRTAYPSVAYVGWDDKTLYVAYTAYNPSAASMEVAATERDGEVWNDDDVELFIDPGADASSFVQICVNSVAAVYDHRDKDSSWNAEGLKVGTKKGEAKWTVEIAVPFAALEAAPKLNSVWNMNFTGHQKTPEDKWISWTTANSFNDPSIFGAVKFIVAAE